MRFGRILGKVFGHDITHALESARHFAKIDLPASRIPNLCAISSTSPSVMVITAEGYFYVYSIDFENGGDCRLQRRFK